MAGVDKRSVDTWMEPSLFRMDVSTGAPPDYFAPEGQNWGFPTYCWEEMAKDGYRWWRRRLRQLSRCALCHGRQRSENDSSLLRGRVPVFDIHAGKVHQVTSVSTALICLGTP